MTAAQTTAAPVPPGARYELIDIVRGFALFGVLAANLIWTSQYFAVTDVQRAALPTAPIDRIAGTLADVFITFKFYTLFSMLFGLGFAVQLARAAHRGSPVVSAYARRLGVLLAIGVMHALLLWFGDILHLYALLGFVLILFRAQSDRAVLAWTAVVGVLAMLLPFLNWLLTAAAAAPEAAGAAPVETERLTRLMSGRWSDIVRVNWAFNAGDYADLTLGSDGIVHWYLSVFWKFLLGFYIGRRLLLQHAERHLSFYRRLLPWTLALGLAGNVLWAVGGAGAESAESPGTAWRALAAVPVELSILLLAVGYLSGIVLVYQRPAGRRLLSRLAPVGRMALTNYLSHSVVFVLLLYGVGLGWLGRLGEAWCLAVAVLVFALQVAGSRWWLARFQFGPAEWIWRGLTYGRLPPLRIAALDLASSSPARDI